MDFKSEVSGGGPVCLTLRNIYKTVHDRRYQMKGLDNYFTKRAFVLAFTVKKMAGSVYNNGSFLVIT